MRNVTWILLSILAVVGLSTMSKNKQLTSPVEERIQSTLVDANQIYIERAQPRRTDVDSYIFLKRKLVRSSSEQSTMRGLLANLNGVRSALKSLSTSVPTHQRIATVEFLGDAMKSAGARNEIVKFLASPEVSRETANDKIELFAKLSSLDPKRAKALLTKDSGSRNSRVLAYAQQFQVQRDTNK